MKKTLYISGSITDPKTGQPREGWQKQFIDAEKRLRKMGFNVISPIDIAKEAEEEWSQQWQAPSGIGRWSGPYDNTMRVKGPTQATYIVSCLQVMNIEALAGRLDGIYVIWPSGDPYAKQRCHHSHGVQMELHMAQVLHLPVFSQFYDDCEIDIHLLPVKDGKRLLDNGRFGKENWSGKL